MVVNPDFIHSLMSKLCDYNLKILDVILECDVDMVYFGDDWGSKSGLIMKKSNWNTFIKPYISKMFQKVKKANKPIILHSCGNIIECFPDLIKMGLDCYQSLSPEIYNIYDVKSKFGNELCLWGGISSQILENATEASQITNDLDGKINILNKNGGFILGTTNPISPACPEENVVTLLQYCKNYTKQL